MTNTQTENLFQFSKTLASGAIIKTANNTTHFYDLRKIPYYQYNPTNEVLIYKHGRGVRLASGMLAKALYAALTAIHEGSAING